VRRGGWRPRGGGASGCRQLRKEAWVEVGGVGAGDWGGGTAGGRSCTGEETDREERMEGNSEMGGKIKK